jgi:hypothetical protein
MFTTHLLLSVAYSSHVVRNPYPTYIPGPSNKMNTNETPVAAMIQIILLTDLEMIHRLTH